jgi:hypothetical protein
MQIDKWLNSLIFESGLFDLAVLSEKEILYIKRYLQDEKRAEIQEMIGHFGTVNMVIHPLGFVLNK